ncbi:MAG: hypothetical protein M3336_01250, partial [Chloroflexota bacterium]|nr:hypothetical protein [Chloroflexota bacterium]
MRVRSSPSYLPQLLGLGIIGFVSVALSTTWGVALSNDSVNYVKVARAAIAGREFTITQYQPLYPAVLVLVGRLGLDVLVAARWLGAGLLLLNVLLIGVFIYRYSDRSRFAAWLGASLFLTSVPVLRMHSFALSEPLFLLLTTASLLLLCGYLDVGRPAWLAGSALTAGLALLTRYLGLPLIATSLLALALLDARRSLPRVLFFAAVS